MFQRENFKDFIDTPMKPCPFCGKKVDLTDEDTMYPSGTLWAFEPELGFRHYFGWDRQEEADGMVWKLGCTPNAGGCGAEIHGDSIQETLDLWNRRA